MAVGALLAAIVRPPPRRTGFYALRGHRIFAVRGASVQGVDVQYRGRRFVARRTASGWDIDGSGASHGASGAIGDLVDTLVTLRAIDVFRPRDQTAFGFDRPHATIDLVTSRRRQRLVLGGLNAAGSALYARHDRDPRVFLVGTLLLSEIERVFYERDGARDSS